MTDEELDQLIERCASRLSEHTESVQIFITKRDEEGGLYTSIETGKGNYWARFGHVKQWLIQQEERTRRSIED